MLGYGVVFLLLTLRRGRSWEPGSGQRRVVVAFLLGLPVVFVASRLRFGGSGAALAVELGGLAIWLGVAAAARRSDAALWAGCAGHGIWDALHLGRAGFIPDWYVAACLAVDVGLGAYALLGLREARSPQARSGPPAGSSPP